MNLKKRFSLILLGVIAVFTLAACGGGGGGGGLQVGTPGESLAFEPTTLSASAGDVTVTFKNNSSAQQHNWVLVNGGADVAAKVDEEAAANSGEVTAGGDILGATSLLAGGASASVTITGLAAGTYTYICTYPGHYAAGMTGTLTVQ